MNSRIASLWVVLVVVLHYSHIAKANVYATNLRLNGNTNNISLSPGSSVTINYILNEPATSGVKFEIFSGTNIVRTVNVAAGNPGTTLGTNSIVWNGKDDHTNSVNAGSYSFRVTAGATGYSDWTQISDDANTNSYIWAPVGIAVNRNTNSPYYGRVFICNGESRSGSSQPADQVGMLKFNADASSPPDGIFSGGGYAWTDNIFQSPWKVRVSSDDKVYVNDFSGFGVVIAFDELITTNNYSLVLRTDNDGPGNLSGPGISGSGTNTHVWMTDIYTGGEGVVLWNVTTNGAIAQNDIGTVAIPVTGDLNLAPYGVDLDASNNLYVIQYVNAGDSASYPLLRFPPYTGTPETVADWKVAPGDPTMVAATGIAVDKSGTYVAVAFSGSGGLNGGGPANVGGNTSIFDATTGALVKQIVTVDGDDHTDVAWDNVGNLYDLDNYGSIWRVFSPPGTNQATTFGLQTIQVTAPLTRPTLGTPSKVGTQVQFALSGQANVSYVIQASTNLVNWTAISTNTSANATQTITVSATASRSFYRATAGQ